MDMTTRVDILDAAVCVSLSLKLYIKCRVVPLHARTGLTGIATSKVVVGPCCNPTMGKVDEHMKRYLSSITQKFICY